MRIASALAAAGLRRRSRSRPERAPHALQGRYIAPEIRCSHSGGHSSIACSITPSTVSTSRCECVPTHGADRPRAIAARRHRPAAYSTGHVITPPSSMSYPYRVRHPPSRATTVRLRDVTTLRARFRSTAPATLTTFLAARPAPADLHEPDKLVARAPKLRPDDPPDESTGMHAIIGIRATGPARTAAASAALQQDGRAGDACARGGNRCVRASRRARWRDERGRVKGGLRRTDASVLARLHNRS